MLESGSRLGPYDISGHIGAGGMGEVYRARDTRLERDVAIKVLPATLNAHPELRSRFQREARAISQLNHPHICTLHDVGQENGIDYIVMEMLEGESLAARIERGPLPLGEVLRYGAQIAEALGAAHARGIVHRDLKPGNVMLTRSGAKLLDFGLAKTVSGFVASSPEAETTHLAPSDPPLTGRGTLVGTFQYMAPEQLEGLDADARTDIFALGALLYEMVTGKRAFDGKTRTSVIAAIVDRDPPPIRLVQPLSPKALEELIRICLAKDPDDRWQNARDVAIQLRALGGGEDDATTTTRAARWRGWIGWAAAAVAIAALAAVLFGARSSDARPVYSAVAPPDGVRLAFEGPGAGSISLSPDGGWMTFDAVGEDGVPRLWLRRVSNGELRTLPGTEGAVYPFWSPDSRQIAFFSNRKLRTMSIDGGTAVDVCDVNEPRGGSWSRDGVIVFTPHWRDPIYRVPATGGTPVPLTKLDASRNETTHRWPLFLPDGKHFLYLAGNHTAAQTSGDNAIYLASLDGSAPRLLFRARSNVVHAGDHLIFLRGQELVAQAFDARSLQLKGEPIRLAEGVRYERGFFQGVFAASERLLMYQGGPTESKSLLKWVSREGKPLQTLGDADVYFDVVLSPDGKSAAVAIGDPADLWLLNLERGSRTRFTFDAWSELSPRWSPDSRSLLFGSDRNVQVDILRKEVGSSSESLLLSDEKIHERPLDWSLDGRFIVVSKIRDDGRSGSDIWIHHADSSAPPFPFAATPYDEPDARFSPDGRSLAYVSNESGRHEVYIDRFPDAGSKTLVSSNGGNGPRWRKDGGELYYVAPNGAVMVVPMTGPDRAVPGSPLEIFRAPIVAVPDPFYDVSPDGTQFLLNWGETEEAPLTMVVDWLSLLKRS